MFKALLQVFVDEENFHEWDQTLANCIMTYGASVHRSTHQSPNFMVAGREMGLPVDLMEDGCEDDKLLASEYVIRLRRILNKTHQLAYRAPLQLGEQVLLMKVTPPRKINLKLFRREGGFLTALEMISDINCRIQYDRAMDIGLVHFNELKPFRKLTSAHQSSN
ncbi:Retrovirus-related Pol polyprotein [Schistosoma japonicum]|uniref:Retrovirus-related Pol polyprotein n=1 Tax=Schistosoma japonicum TaxID=6182 RepID=A0A4Z2DS84_SCHJA|nr:Retrovirus-related Pol polyprotein [Schistosoma japonicum]